MRVILIIIVLIFVSCQVYAQDSESKTWNLRISKGDLRLWSIRDVQRLLSLTKDQNQRINKVSIHTFDSLCVFEDSIINRLIEIHVIKELRLAGFSNDPVSDTRLINKFLTINTDSLITLDIISSNFKSFSDTFVVHRLNSLKYLKLWNNNIIDISMILAQLKPLINLNTIDFYDNPIKQIPNAAQMYGSIRVLELSATKLESIPCELFVESNITAFGVMNTKITKLPECLLNINKCITFGLTRTIEKRNKKTLMFLNKKCLQ